MDIDTAVFLATLEKMTPDDDVYLSDVLAAFILVSADVLGRQPVVKRLEAVDEMRRTVLKLCPLVEDHGLNVVDWEA